MRCQKEGLGDFLHPGMAADCTPTMGTSSLLSQRAAQVSLATAAANPAGLPRGHCAHGLHPTGLASVMGSPGLDLRGSQLLTQQPPKRRGAREEMSCAGPASAQGATQLPENHLGEMFSCCGPQGAGALGCRRHKGGKGRQGKGVERCWLPGALPTTLPPLQVSDQTGSSGS